MNKQELIEKINGIATDTPFANAKIVDHSEVIELIKQLDEPQPIKLKNVTARIKQLDIGTRKVWLDEFLNELGSDYGTLKYKAGYEQGKFDGAVEREKVQVPQFVADWIDNMKCQGKTLYYGLDHTPPEEVDLWFCEDEVNRQNTFARAWLDGYTIEKEPKYTVKCKATKQYLSNDELGTHFDPSFRSNFTKSDLEKLGLGWVFDCEGMEVEKVEDE